MKGVQVSSSQVTDKLWYVKGVNGEMSKCTPKQTNIGTTKMPNGKDIRREIDLLRPSTEPKCIDKWQ